MKCKPKINGFIVLPFDIGSIKLNKTQIWEHTKTNGSYCNTLFYKNIVLRLNDSDFNENFKIIEN